MANFPSFVLPDTGGLARELGQDLVSTANMQTQRQYAANEQRRLSAREAMERDKLAREAAADELKQQESRWKALPNVMRLAQTNPDMAAANPYGIKVESQVSHPALPKFNAEPQVAPELDTLPTSHGSPDELLNAPTQGHPLAGPMPGPLQGPTPSGAPLSDMDPPPEAAPPDLDVEALTAARTPADTRHTFATVNGQRFEVPAGRDAPGSDADFEQVYGYFLDQTGNPESAMRMAVNHAQRLQDHADKLRSQAEIERKNKAAEAEALRVHADVPKQDEWKHLAAAGKKKSGGGGGGVNPGMAELIRMKEQGTPDSAIADRAAALHIPMGGKTGYLQAIKEVRSAANADARIDEKIAQETFAGPDGQPVVGMNAKAAGKAAEANTKFSQVRERMKYLLADIQANGTRVSPFDIAGTKRRESAIKGVVAVLRPYNELSSTDASVKLEEAMTAGGGTLGDGLLAGAQPEVLQHLLEEAESRHREQNKNYSRPTPAAHAAPSGITRVAMPDGSVQEFDASGKRVK